MSEKDFLMFFEGVPTYSVSRKQINEEINILNLLTEKTSAFKSKGELRRMLQSNAISLNKEKINIEKNVTGNDLINDHYLLIQKGKKNYIIIKVE